MRRINFLHVVAVITGLVLLGASSAQAGFNIDFTTDDGGNPLVNGQDITSPPEFGNLFDVSASGPNLGAAIFDSADLGPNLTGPDPDLLVSLGNIMILQNNGNSAQTVAGIFDTPDDDADGGTLFFDFLISNVFMESIDLVDINGSGHTIVTLTDSGGMTRVYDVPDLWTKDVFVDGPNGWQTLDLTTLAPQLGEGGSTATASQDGGFDPNDVTQLKVRFFGSAGLDNIAFTPEPGSLALFALASSIMFRRRRSA